MLFYQALIMCAVILVIYTLAFFLKLKKRKLFVIAVIVLITAGGIALYAIQYYFGNHYYTQQIDNETIEGIGFTANQKKNVSKIFSDYKKANESDKSTYALDKIYKVNGNGAKSEIEANIYIFSNSHDADNYFKASQKFYDNKNYIPLDSDKSKREGKGEYYLVSLIKSQYKDYADIIYLPSKITYSSDLVIEDKNVIIHVSETANKPVTNKQKVINDIKHRLNITK
jgi:hypothetical protein